MKRINRILLPRCLLLLAILWISPGLGLWDASGAMGTFTMAFTVVVAGVVLAAFAIAWAENEQNEKTILNKIAEFEERNYSLHSEQVQRLTHKDISSLSTYKIIVLSVAAAIGVIIIAVIFMMSMGDLLKLTAAAVSISTFLTILLAINKRMNLMFEQGKKTVVKGVVTKKNIGVDDAKDKAYNWLYIGDRKVKVEISLYHTYHIGYVVEFHVYEGFGTFILHHERIGGAGIEAE